MCERVRKRTTIYATRLLVVLIGVISTECRGDEFTEFLNPLVAEHCLKCHGGEEVSGEFNFKPITTAAQLLAQPTVINKMIQAVDSNDMPPEGEPPLHDSARTRLLTTLKTMLREATSDQQRAPAPIRRLNRLQYNNSVRDLFKLKLDVFELPEKLMTRQDNYLHPASGKMPDKVRVASLSLKPQPGLRDVNAFPKDLRAAHGFDNQANQLTLSPLLLDAFLRLSVSIVESPDFNEHNVGIWNEFFLQPGEGTDPQAEVKRRLSPFLTIAFRSPVEPETLDRYADYARSKIKQGLSFTDSMKKVASAVLSSPMFLYHAGEFDGHQALFALASNLSYFLWGSCPDQELLQLAANGQLAQLDVLNRTIERMMADPKIERLLDAFPTQWLQLENVLAATPDPQISKYYQLEKDNPAGLQMLLEPLLLFDAVFVEDRPILELISPTFSYHSVFLKTWYTSELQAPRVDFEKIADDNLRNDEQRRILDGAIKAARAELEALIVPVKTKLEADRQSGPSVNKAVDLKPFAAWEFNGDFSEQIRSLELSAHGKVEFKDGMVVLNGAYLQSRVLPIDLKAKSLEVFFQVHGLDQHGGGVMGIQGPGDFFDAIVIGERKPQHWISGSNVFSRTEDFPESTPETKDGELLHLMMVYTEDGTTTLYRDGKPYGKPFRKGAATFPKDQSSVLFGLRHLPPGGNRFLKVSIDKARLYDRALTADEVAAAAEGNSSYISDQDLLLAMTAEEKELHAALNKTIDETRVALKQVPPNQQPEQLQQEEQRRFEDQLRAMMRSPIFERVEASDPRFGGIITNAAMLSMTSGPKRTHPIARGAWIIEVIFNDPPPPPPNDIPPLTEDDSAKDLTIREKFAAHRNNPSCASCHSRIDPLGFAMENFDITGRWRDSYENGKPVDSSGTLLRTYPFDNVVGFKQSLVKEDQRFARAFTSHLLRFALARELLPADSIMIDTIVSKTANADFRLRSLIREVALSLNSFSAEK
jgi:Protein of unknown function (DUF1588)/Protein of unknown function (DUF1592)/Protein of unknown function (DUF1585)/Protein of unknown function (DUF1595)/Concanavalin A-like lectin/glucanases superfamily/Protein of unknown function (DUF1587)